MVEKTSGWAVTLSPDVFSVSGPLQEIDVVVLEGGKRCHLS